MTGQDMNSDASTLSIDEIAVFGNVECDIRSSESFTRFRFLPVTLGEGLWVEYSILDSLH